MVIIINVPGISVGEFYSVTYFLLGGFFVLFQILVYFASRRPVGNSMHLIKMHTYAHTRVLVYKQQDLAGQKSFFYYVKKKKSAGLNWLGL